MKRNKWLFLMAFLLVFSCFTLSCGDDDEDIDKPKTEEPKNDDEPGSGGGDTAVVVDNMTIAEQKEYIETVGIELVREVESTDFNNLKKMSRYISDTYSDYDADGVEEWYDKCIDAISELIATERNSYSNYYYTENTYRRIYVISNFTGHFEAKYRKWNYTDANDLQFAFTDEKGLPCVATLTASGSTKRMYVGEDYEEEWEWFNDGYRITTDISKNYFEIPQVINVTLTQNGTTLIDITVKTDLSSVAGDEIDLNRDKLSAETTVIINNYVIKINKASYSPSAASASFLFSKGGKKLISFSVSADGEYDENTDPLFGAKSTVVSFDALGKIQIKGTCSNVSKFNDYLERSDENDEDESSFRYYIDRANELLDLDVYYNSDKVQAEFKLEPCYNDDYYYGYWSVEPYFYFFDGTSYRTFKDFFDESSFSTLVHTFESMVEDFEYLFEE